MNIISKIFQGILPYIVKVQETKSRIIERGISNDWHYEKYSDGTAKCWREIMLTENKATKSSGGVYIWDSGSTEHVGHWYNLPTGLFIQTPNVQISLESGMANKNIILYENTSKNIVEFIIQSHASDGNSRTYTVNLLAHGTWTILPPELTP